MSVRSGTSTLQCQLVGLVSIASTCWMLPYAHSLLKYHWMCAEQPPCKYSAKLFWFFLLLWGLRQVLPNYFPI